MAQAGSLQTDPTVNAEPRVLSPRPRRFLPGRRSIAVVVVVAALAAGFFYPITQNSYIELLGETLFVGIALLMAFTAAGAWEQRLVPRWVAQVLAVALAAALAPLVVQMLSAGGDISRFLASRGHVRGYMMVTLVAAVIGVVLALGSLFRQRDTEAREQALQLALLREKMDRQAADARLALLSAQIQPHFLLNTLANVQELVESGSPRAVPVFRSLIAYLRASIPQLQQEGATLEEEEKLVRAYLELMQMRMPDRLSFSIDIPQAVRGIHFPQMALLTLVENSIRHGVDPSCDCTEVEVGAALAQGTLRLWVADTGVGMPETAREGTGLTNLRARVRAFYGEQARFELSEQLPHGLRAELVLPLKA